MQAPLWMSVEITLISAFAEAGFDELYRAIHSYLVKKQLTKCISHLQKYERQEFGLDDLFILLILLIGSGHANESRAGRVWRKL